MKLPPAGSLLPALFSVACHARRKRFAPDRGDDDEQRLTRGGRCAIRVGLVAAVCALAGCGNAYEHVEARILSGSGTPIQPGSSVKSQNPSNDDTVTSARPLKRQAEIVLPVDLAGRDLWER